MPEEKEIQETPKDDLEETPKDEPKEAPKDVISADVLPEEFRGKSEAEIKFLLGRMADVAATGGSQVGELRRQLEELQTKVSEPPKEPDPDDDLSDEELIQKDAQKAINRILAREGIVNRFDSVESKSNEAALMIVGRDLEDFDEVREDVEAILKGAGSSYSRADIVGAYKMALGHRVMESKAKEKKRAANLETPKPTKDLKEDYPELTGLEADIFAASGMSREDWESYKSDDHIEIEVPLK